MNANVRAVGSLYNSSFSKKHRKNEKQKKKLMPQATKTATKRQLKIHRT